MKHFLLVLFLASWSFRVGATDYYVSAAGSDNNDGKSSAKPLLSLQKAAGLTQPGDTVFAMNGTYAATSGPVLNITRSGQADKYITYKAFPGHSPKITAAGNVWNAVVINGSFIVFEGFELVGNNANITYEAAFKAYSDNIAGTAGPNGNFNTNGLSIGGPRTESKLPHHIVIRACTGHDFPGGGISAIQTDYVTIDNNLVYNNAWYMMYAGSGISILNPFNSDRETIYKNIVRNNRCFANKTTIPWVSIKKLSDGNGIIIDVNQYPYDGKAGDEAYTGRTLVENNLSVANGGSGIHAFKADHVDIINNTAYQNGVVLPDYANIFANTCTDVNIIGNIMYAATGKKCNSNNKNVNVRYDYNLYFNGEVAVQGPHDIIAYPEFVNPSDDPILANFKVKPSSPAIDAGSPVAGEYSPKDLLGIGRPQGKSPDRGAYEFIDGPISIITALNPAPSTGKPILFPNPTQDTVSVQFSETPPLATQIKIITSQGIEVKKQELTRQLNEVSIGSLVGGSYLVVITQNGKTLSVQTFVKQ